MENEKLKDFEMIKKYVEERIRIDNIQDGFAKGYAEGTVIRNNSNVLYAISRLELRLKQENE